MSDAPEFLFWLDIETTGLDPWDDKILEVAAVVTTGRLERVAEFHAVVRHDGTRVRERLAYAGEKVAVMHAKSGLLDAVANRGRPELAVRAELQALAGQYPRAPLAGSSPHFDRRFVDTAWGPGVLDALHYRNVDVSTLRTTFQLDHPELVWKQSNAHRALDDVMDHIAEYAHYRRCMRAIA